MWAMTRLTLYSGAQTSHSRMTRWLLVGSPIGESRKTGPTGLLQRGEIWFAATPGGDRPVLGADTGSGCGSHRLGCHGRTHANPPRPRVRAYVDRRRGQRIHGARSQLRQHPHDSARLVPPESHQAEACKADRSLPETAQRHRSRTVHLSLMLAGQSKGTSPKLCPEGSLDSNICSYGQLEGEESRTGGPALVGHILGSAPDRDMGGATGPSRQVNPIRRRPIRYACVGARVVTLTPWLTPWSRPTG